MTDSEHGTATRTRVRPAPDARVPRPRRGSHTTEERTRRRFVRRRWARRWLRWRPALAVLVLLGLVGGGLWVVLGSRLLAAEDVSVSGTQLLGTRQVESIAAVPLGTPLARLDLAAVERRVESLAEVDDATVTREWPHGVAVRVREREAVAVVELAGALRGMDADGVLFRDFGRAPRGLPRVLMPSGTTSEAMIEAARVIEALPGDLVPRVDHVEVGSMDDVSLVLRGGRQVVWGSAEASDAKAEVLDALLRAVRAGVYDVSVPGQPTTRAAR